MDSNIISIQEESKEVHNSMSTQNVSMCYCPIGGIIDLISRKWTLCVINTLNNHGKLRFNEIMTELKTISPKTLTKTLKELEEEKFIQRSYFKDIPLRVEYNLTLKGETLWKLIFPLLQWVSEHTEKEFLSCCNCTSPNC